MILEKIDSKLKSELGLTFKEMKKLADPFMNHLKFSDIQIFFWIKKNNKRQRTYGVCYPGLWKIPYKNKNGRNYKRYFRNLIILWKEYYEKMDLSDIKELFKHELLHLVAKDCHGKDFKKLAMCCKTIRYAKSIKNENT